MRLEFPAPPLTRKRERALRVAARRLAPLARLREQGQGGETGNSRSMLRARRTAYRCSGMCALQGRACRQLPTVSYSYEMLNSSGRLRGAAPAIATAPLRVRESAQAM